MSSSQPKKRFRAKVPLDKRKRTALACEACRRRKRKCLQQASGVCAQCQEYRIECHFEPISNSADRVPGGTNRATTKWQASLAEQHRVENEIRRLHPGVDVSFEVIQSAAMAIEKFRSVEDPSSTRTPLRGSPEQTSNAGFIEDFPRTISQAVGKPMESPTPDGSLEDFDDDREAISELLTELPPWSKAETLTAACFQYGESNWYYCDQARFRQRLSSLYQYGEKSVEATAGFVSSSFMILALGTHFQHLTTSSSYAEAGEGDQSRLLGKRYFDAAQRLHVHLMQRVSIEGVQATLLMALFLLPTGRRDSNYTFMGLSLRMAMALSLHRQERNPRPLAEETRRMFWTVWCLEKHFSLAWRAPDMVREGDITTPLPVYNASLDEKNPSKLSRLTAFIDLTRIQSSAARKSASTWRLEDILKIEEQLETWNRNLPDLLRSNEPEHMRANIHLQIMYNKIWLELGRTPLLDLVKQGTNRRNSTTLNSPEAEQRIRLAKLCASSAQEVLRLIHMLRQAGMLASFSYTDFHACSSAVVLLLVDSILHPRLGIADIVGRGIETLETLAAGNEYAQQGVTLVKRFCNMLSKFPPELSTSNIYWENRASVQSEERGGPKPDGQAVLPESPFIDAISSVPYSSVQSTTGVDAIHLDRPYEAADFAALEAIMGTESDPWNDDQTPQDLYFFGFADVGPSF